MINGQWSLARAKALASRIEHLAPAATDDDRIILAYRLAFGRSPEPGELSDAVAFLDRQARLTQPAPKPTGAMAGRAALFDFCHVLFNSNQFLYVD